MEAASSGVSKSIVAQINEGKKYSGILCVRGKAVCVEKQCQGNWQLYGVQNVK